MRTLPEPEPDYVPHSLDVSSWLLIFLILATAFFIGCSHDRIDRNDIPPSPAEQTEKVDHALDSYDTSSPPVVRPTWIFSDAVACVGGNLNGEACCDPICPTLPAVNKQAQGCYDKTSNTIYIPVVNSRIKAPCYEMDLKAELLACAAVHCQVDGCGAYDEFFSSQCVRE